MDKAVNKVNTVEDMFRSVLDEDNICNLCDHATCKQNAKSK